MGVALDEAGNVLVVGGATHNVCEFTPEGMFLGELTQAGMGFPRGIAFDDRGHLFVTAVFGIFEFDAVRSYVQTITAGSLDFPRAIAFAPRRFGKIRHAGQVTVGAAGPHTPASSSGWLLSLAGLR